MSGALGTQDQSQLHSECVVSQGKMRAWRAEERRKGREGGGESGHLPHSPQWATTSPYTPAHWSIPKLASTSQVLPHPHKSLPQLLQGPTLKLFAVSTMLNNSVVDTLGVRRIYTFPNCCFKESSRKYIGWIKISIVIIIAQIFNSCSWAVPMKCLRPPHP